MDLKKVSQFESSESSPASVLLFTAAKQNQPANCYLLLLSSCLLAASLLIAVCKKAIMSLLM